MKGNQMESERNIMGKWNGKEDGNKYLMAQNKKYHMRKGIEYRIK